MHHKITTAIIPVAGLGTRFLPATKAQPKEMLPIVDKPIIQYIVEEAVAAGIENIIFVTAHTKRAIEDHFDRNFELEYRLEQQKKKKELEIVSRIGKLAHFAFVRQAKPRGDGDALLAALPFLDDDEPFAVFFGDDLIDSKTPAIRQLMDVYENYGGSVIAVERIPKSDVSKYGIVAGKRVADKIIKAHTIVEKPKEKEAPSDLGAIGRYIVTPKIAQILKNLKTTGGTEKELRLADAFGAGLAKKEPIYAREITGTRYDCGTKLGFILASVALGLKHPELHDDLQVGLKKLIRP